MISRNIYIFCLGFTLSVLFVFPAYRPGGVPVCYIAVGVLSIAAYFLGLRRIVPEMRILWLWALLMAYVFFYSLYFKEPYVLSHVAMSGTGLLMGILLLFFLRTEKDMVYFVLGCAPLMMLDSVVATGQVFNLSWSQEIGRIFVTSDAAMQAYLHQLSTKSVWGLQLHAHGYAIDQTVWSFFVICGLFSLKKSNKVSHFVMYFILMTGCLGVYVSFMRSVVWSFFSLVLVLSCVCLKRIPIRATSVIIGVMAIIFCLSILGDVLDQESRSGLDRRGRITNITKILLGDKRIETYKEAVRIISKGPFFGRAFDEYAMETSIHNGILNGWARYGLPFVILLISASGFTLYEVLVRNRSGMWVKVSALSLFMIIGAQVMVHTLTPGKCDWIIPISVGFIAAFLKINSDGLKKFELSN